jgi:hypothetical protein
MVTVRQSKSRTINFILSCISQGQNRNATGFSNNSSGMTDAQPISMKRFLIVVVRRGFSVLTSPAAAFPAEWINRCLAAVVVKLADEFQI